MPSDCLSFQNSGYFTPLINDYLDRDPRVSDLFHRFPERKAFQSQMSEKSAFFSPEKRKLLVAALRNQYQSTDATLATLNNLEKLSGPNTFTVTTGHQLNLFTGPLYFLYKIVSTINLSRELNNLHPESHFVPVYWMATEDHDFDEISYFNFKGLKFKWNREGGGPVGKLSTAGLDEVLKAFETALGPSDNAAKIVALFRKAYLEHSTLTAATRWLANELFGEYGLVIIDGDDPDLKREFLPYMREDLEKNTAFHSVSQTIGKMSGYTAQVNPREINLFYLGERLRERIVTENDGFRVLGTSLFFTPVQLMDELLAYPERFSPNVIMRPLYQEAILPNLAYIGGGGEIAYWLELKSFFESQRVPFPMLMLRNSVVMASEKQDKKRKALELSWKDLFSKRMELENNMASRLSDFPLELDAQRETLQVQFAYLESLIEKTDPSFSGAVKAQKAKQMKGLAHLEKRLAKAQRRKFEDQISRAVSLQEELFKNGGLQERQVNFSEIFIETSDSLIPKLLETLDPFETSFVILTY